MTLPKSVWSQLKNKSADELISALLRDGWSEDLVKGSIRVYRHEDGRRVAIHYHPRKTYGPRLLSDLLDDIGWSEADMRRLKLVR